ncbi:MAG: Uncharacterised protein [Flavobacteriaceae bacterium]|nr:MAG: Uncharacterised protein [Flavobacteriaceae bacterium]
MNSKAIFLSLLFLCFFTSTSAQIILLEGRVTNPDEVENIHVLNTTSRYNAITDQEGKFTIEAKRYDTLVFSGIKYFSKKVVVTDKMYAQKYLSVSLIVLLNELDEVFIGNTLSGDLLKDAQSIKTNKEFNFDDVGIPGFKGKPQEKIPKLVGQVITPLSLDVEGLYKHITGYYKALKRMRKWRSEDYIATEILTYYTASFFLDAYKIPKNRTYDFIMLCIETSDIEKDFKIKNYNGVLTTFKEKSSAYIYRLDPNKRKN